MPVTSLGKPAGACTRISRKIASITSGISSAPSCLLPARPRNEIADDIRIPKSSLSRSKIGVNQLLILAQRRHRARVHRSPIVDDKVALADRAGHAKVLLHQQ